MRVTRPGCAYRDRRGTITDILTDKRIDAITIITCEKGSVRGNHYHKKTMQYAYLLSGRMRFFARRGGGKLRAKTVRPGELMENPPGESHAFLALEDSVFLSMSSGPRKGMDFEKDTFRLVRPMARPANGPAAGQ